MRTAPCGKPQTGCILTRAVVGKARIEKQNGYNYDDLDVTLIAPSIKMPILMSQVRKDYRTTVEDIQEMFDALGSEDKEMFWIDEYEERLEGYNYFWRDNPEKLFSFLDKH